MHNCLHSFPEQAVAQVLRNTGKGLNRWRVFQREKPGLGENSSRAPQCVARPDHAGWLNNLGSWL